MPPFEDEHAALLAATLRQRVTRYLERRARVTRESDALHDDVPEPELLALICAASAQNRGALAPESPPPTMTRIGLSRAARSLPTSGSLCVEDDGFSLHAQVFVPVGERERLEDRCRCVARPAIASGH